MFTSRQTTRLAKYRATCAERGIKPATVLDIGGDGSLLMSDLTVLIP